MRPDRFAQTSTAAQAAYRVMLVDDSLVARSIIERIIGDAGGFDVVASVPRAPDAIRWLERDSVDIIILDLEMPDMGGIDALPLLIAQGQGARILILSANCPSDGPAAIEALARGAADTLLKPGRGGFAGTFGSTLVDRLRELGAAGARAMLRNTPVANAAAPAQVERLPDKRPLAAIGIGGSTGGIASINALLGALPADHTVPLLVTQHLPASFIDFFAAQLRTVVRRPVHVATEGMRIEPRGIYVAPGDAHLSLARRGDIVTVTLDRRVSATRSLPSVDTMFDAMARVYGADCLAVVLSGMGRDGCEGARAIRESAGLIVAQDVETSVVWGMPGSVARDGLAHAVMPPEQIGRAIAGHALMAVRGL